MLGRETDDAGGFAAAGIGRTLGLAGLRGAGLTLADVVKTTVFLVDMADFEAMNQVYGPKFPVSPPARTTVAVSGLPRNARVEIECVAIGREF